MNSFIFAVFGLYSGRVYLSIPYLSYGSGGYGGFTPCAGTKWKLIDKNRNTQDLSVSSTMGLVTERNEVTF